MPFQGQCPSCGAAVTFKSAASFHAVCEFCRSTLVRHDGRLESLGLMAELLEDASPLQLGSEGSYRGVHFALIGRIQLRYEAGLWNEWHLLFDDMRTGWLSEANGEYVLSFLTPPEGELPAYEHMSPERRLYQAGREWTATDVREAQAIAGAGELPFGFGAGYPVQLVDLRALDGAKAFATIDYSETPPLFFVGEPVTLASLRLTNLREVPQAKAIGQIRALSCPQCGSPIELHDPAIQRVACGSCLSLLNAEDPNLKVLQRMKEALRVEPLIPLASVGRFGAHEWTVIGFQQRVVEAEGVEYPWQEYLLHHPAEGFRWLVESKGHWTWVSPVANPPRYSNGMQSTSWQGGKYVRFSCGVAETRFVVGEFNWRVQVGEKWDTLDLVCEQKMLSRELSKSEASWSLGEYRTPEEIQTAFKLAKPLPKPTGVGALEPNPRRAPHRKTCAAFWCFALAALAMQIGWSWFGGEKVLAVTPQYQVEQDEAVATPDFKLAAPARSLTLNHETDLDNNWIGLGLTLVNKTTGQAWASSTEISYWHGVDDGESWSEGNRGRELVFRDLPAGDYYLVLDPEFSDIDRRPVRANLTIHRDEAPVSNFFLLLVFLMLFPLVSRMRVAGFEGQRWSQADFTMTGAEPSTSDDSDDDSGSDD